MGTLNPCTRFPPNPTSTKVNTEELTSQQPTKENIKNKENHCTIWGKLGIPLKDTSLLSVRPLFHPGGSFGGTAHSLHSLVGGTLQVCPSPPGELSHRIPGRIHDLV